MPRTRSLPRSSIAVLLAALVFSAGFPFLAQKSSDSRQSISSIVELLRNRNFDEAIRETETRLKSDPRDYRIWTLRGMAFAGHENWKRALEAYQRALTLSPDYLPALEGAAQTEYREGSPDARPLLLRVLAQRPDDPTSLAMLGFLEYRGNNCHDAIPHFEKSETALAAQPLALAAYAACLAQSGEYGRAVPLFRQALAAGAADSSIRFNLALAEWKAGQAQDALATLQPLVEAGRPEIDALRLAAAIYESDNDTQHAVELLRRAILEQPGRIDAYLDFADLSFDHASAQVGIDIVNAGITQLPREARLYLARGVLYTQVGKFDEAASDFSTANRLDPELSLAGTAEGIAASQMHKSDEALNQFRSTATLHPKDALNQYLLAEALSVRGPSAESPEFREELAAARQACKLDPSSTAAHDLLATIYLQEGNTDLAEEQSRAALALDPKDQQAIYHLVLALRKRGRKEEVATLLKQLAALRSAAQADLSQNKRYQLQEVPVTASDR